MAQNGTDIEFCKLALDRVALRYSNRFKSQASETTAKAFNRAKAIARQPKLSGRSKFASGAKLRFQPLSLQAPDFFWPSRTDFFWAGAQGIATRNKELLGAPGIATRCDRTLRTGLVFLFRALGRNLRRWSGRTRASAKRSKLFQDALLAIATPAMKLARQNAKRRSCLPNVKNQRQFRHSIHCTSHRIYATKSRHETTKTCKLDLLISTVTKSDPPSTHAYRRRSTIVTTAG